MSRARATVFPRCPELCDHGFETGLLSGRHLLLSGSVRSPNARQQAPAHLARILRIAGQFTMEKLVLENGAANEYSNDPCGRQQRPPGTQGDQATQSAGDTAQVPGMANELIRSAGDQLVTALGLNPHDR